MYQFCSARRRQGTEVGVRNPATRLLFRRAPHVHEAELALDALKPGVLAPPRGQHPIGDLDDGHQRVDVGHHGVERRGVLYQRAQQRLALRLGGRGAYVYTQLAHGAGSARALRP